MCSSGNKEPDKMTKAGSKQPAFEKTAKKPIDLTGKCCYTGRIGSVKEPVITSSPGRQYIIMTTGRKHFHKTEKKYP
jgi:hypothetical protein